MEVASELGVDEVVDHGIDQGGGHGQQVDTQVHVLYPGKAGNFYKGKTNIYNPLHNKGGTKMSLYTKKSCQKLHRKKVSKRK